MNSDVSASSRSTSQATGRVIAVSRTVPFSFWKRSDCGICFPIRLAQWERLDADTLAVTCCTPALHIQDHRDRKLKASKTTFDPVPEPSFAQEPMFFYMDWVKWEISDFLRSENGTHPYNWKIFSTRYWIFMKMPVWIKWYVGAMASPIYFNEMKMYTRVVRYGVFGEECVSYYGHLGQLPNTVPSKSIVAVLEIRITS